MKIELDPEVIVPRVQGREGWLREARERSFEPFAADGLSDRTIRA